MAQRGFYDGIRTINADAITLFLQPGRFEEVQDGMILSIGSVNGSTVTSLFISDQRDPSVDLTYFAKEAKILERDKASYLLLYNGQLHRRTTADGAVSIIQFQTYAFDLASLRPESDGDWIRTSERATSELLFPDPNDADFQAKPDSYAKELAQRMSDWLYPIAMALWALVMASQPRTNRQGPGIAMALGIAGGLVLKALGFVSLSLVDRDPRLVFVVYLIPALFILGSVVLIRLDVNISQLTVFDRIGDAMRQAGRSLRGLVSAPAPAGGKPRP
jgi:lipopolysaccharide export system permease protein